MAHLYYFSPLDCTMQFWDEDETRQLRLEGEISANFNAEKLCTGYNDGERMRPCPGRFQGKKQCTACAARDISRVYTRLDHSGFEKFYESFRNQEFSLYLVSFGHLVKCGVTRHARLQDRVREQGADYFAEIGRMQGAETAYSLEYAVQQNFSVRNFVTSAQKMKLAGVRSQDRLSEYVSKVRESGLLEGMEGAMEVKKLDYPVPERFSEADHVGGRILGNKGPILFFENEGCHAVNMSKKTGSLFSYSLMGS